MLEQTRRPSPNARTLPSSVDGDGAYTLSGFPSNGSGLDGQGPSRVIVYANPHDFRRNMIVTGENIATVVAGGAIASTLNAS